MSQRFTVTAFSRSDGDRSGPDIQGEVNQLFEGDEPTPSSSNKEVSFSTEVLVMQANSCSKRSVAGDPGCALIFLKLSGSVTGRRMVQRSAIFPRT
ncbi:hypothetical protein UPYG_G00163020 [Umbra pygmaea]|uniref:Uncharacterized protein n=1 Tax=Umbra pygmaea TaxID=75934 RepID=A0ABD0WM00_UMBPY